MCELLVGLPDVDVNGVGDWPLFLRIAVSTIRRENASTMKHTYAIPVLVGT